MTTNLYRLSPLTTITAAAMKLSESEMEARFGAPVEVRPDNDDLRKIARKRHCSIGRARSLWDDGIRD